MASRDLGTFALRLLEIARTSRDLSFATMWPEFTQLYGPMPFATFSKKVVESFEAGYFGLAGGTFPSAPDADMAVELTARGVRQVFKQLYTKIDGRTIEAGVEKLKEELGVDLLRNANRQLFDGMLRHQIMLLRLDRGIRDEVFRILDATEKEIAERVSRLPAGRATLGSARLKLLEKFIRETRLDAWDKVTETWIERLIDIAKQEVRTVAGIAQTSSPVEIDFVMPSVTALRGIVRTNPFAGRTLSRWADNVAEADISRMLDQIKIGLVQGETGPQIAKRIVGSARLKGSDGVTQITRNNAEAITRTAVNSLMHAAREAFYDENPGIFDRERFVATLDGRTTPVCRANDGKVFNKGEGPRPPLHFNCRSVRVPYFGEDALWKRPVRNFTEKGLLRSFAEAEGLDTVPKSRDALPRGYKGLFDKYAQTQMRRQTSIVPATETYQSWLSRQPKEFVEDLLGPTRAKLFRSGNLTLERFVDNQGKNLNLSDLARLHRQAFVAAGLDPEDFL